MCWRLCLAYANATRLPLAFYRCVAIFCAEKPHTARAPDFHVTSNRTANAVCRENVCGGSRHKDWELLALISNNDTKYATPPPPPVSVVILSGK